MTESKPTGFGAVLRRRREELALSLEDMAASTRIRKTYLQALEDENLQALPGSTYAVGFLRIYARQLSLPVEPLLAALDAAEASGSDTEDLQDDSRTPRRWPRGRRGPGRRGRLWLLLLLLAGVAAVYLGLRAGSLPEPSAPAPPPQPQPVVQQPVPQPVPQPQPVVPPVAPQPPPTGGGEAGPPEVRGSELAVLPAGGAVVRMLPTAAGAMKVSLDGQESRTYDLQPGQPLHWKVSDSLAIELSSPGLVRIWVAEQEVPVAEYPALVLTRSSSPEARP